jgi:hypothetical protein
MTLRPEQSAKAQREAPLAWRAPEIIKMLADSKAAIARSKALLERMDSLAIRDHHLGRPRSER